MGHSPPAFAVDLASMKRDNPGTRCCSAPNLPSLSRLVAMKMNGPGMWLPHRGPATGCRGSMLPWLPMTVAAGQGQGLLRALHGHRTAAETA